jgi:hypothetical protein
LQVHPRTGHDSPEEGEEIDLYSFFNLGGRWWWVFNAMLHLPYPRNNLVPIVKEAG